MKVCQHTFMRVLPPIRRALYGVSIGQSCCKILKLFVKILQISVNQAYLTDFCKKQVIFFHNFLAHSRINVYLCREIIKERVK